MTDPGAPRFTNRLAQETSPYLLQHAHNPVEWYPWGPEALERARREDRPILLSIGYAACHWCHVMERESFEDEAIAQLMNEHFVCIKVDREERPDLDELYMTATVAMSGGGGWPMTVFLTPEQEPFFAGTYFPPRDVGGRPGFPTLLAGIHEAWVRERQALTGQARSLTERIREHVGAPRPADVPATALAEAVEDLSLDYDPRWGGFGSAPKFPPHHALALLARQHARTGDERALEMLRGTLDAMRRGGLYDHLAGGFARYSTDDEWHVPHFEKMLYDNAQLARAYVEAWQLTGEDDYARVARETLDWMARELGLPEGGFASATDADSEGVEGRYFVWSHAEVEQVLGATEAAVFAAAFDVTPGGNWEGANVLRQRRPLEELARALKLEPPALRERLDAARARLLEARRRRTPPLTDDKIVTAWNGLAIGAFAEAARVLDEPRYLEVAERAARHLLERVTRPDGGLFRTARGARAHLDAYLDDYAFLGDGLLDLYEAGGDASFLGHALRLAERLVEDFGDGDGAFHHTSRHHEALLARPRDGHDGATPSANAVAARLLARLSRHLARPALAERAAVAVRAYGGLIERAPRAFATTLCVVDQLLEGPVELCLAGDPAAPETRALARAAARRYLPNRVVAHAPGRGTAGVELPLVAGKGTGGAPAALHVCREYACQAPVTDPAAVPAAVTEALRALAAARGAGVAVPRVEGGATVDGTATLAERFLPRHPRGYTVLGRTGLTVSRIGFGGYRIRDGEPEHRAALERALAEGVNLIDTSVNYGDGSSERLIGDTLRAAFARGELRRDQVVLVSKVGYVQGKSLAQAQAREADGDPVAEMVRIGDDAWHCIHPEWIERQIGESLGRLGVAALDVCLLHNPEYFLTEAAKSESGTLDERRGELARRLEAAFRHLELEVKRGRIRCYGVSSNTLTAPVADPSSTTLWGFLRAARAAGGEEHRLRVAQLPANLLEGGAALLEKDGEAGEQTVLEVAAREGLAVLVNRPLNAMGARGLVRLADPPVIEPPMPFDAAVERVEELEGEFRSELAAGVRVARDAQRPETLFAWAEQLRSFPARLEGLEQWQEAERDVIVPRVARLFHQLDRAFGSGERAEQWPAWRDRYGEALAALLGAVAARAAERSRTRAGVLRAALAPHLPEASRPAPLSQQALGVLLSLTGVTTVLVGMRREPYVRDALAAVDRAGPRDPRAALEAAAAAVAAPTSTAP
ncbi:MAG: DUF255 domain-containing protein [Polyangiaceae bacterium]|nr:DUF255 domain-containing protein [Polyangiaceae bacterium]